MGLCVSTGARKSAGTMRVPMWTKTKIVIFQLFFFDPPPIFECFYNDHSKWPQMSKS